MFNSVAIFGILNFACKSSLNMLKLMYTYTLYVNCHTMCGSHLYLLALVGVVGFTFTVFGGCAVSAVAVLKQMFQIVHCRFLLVIAI